MRTVASQFPAIVKLTERVYGQLAEWLVLPPLRNSRPQSAHVRTPEVKQGHGGRDLFANDGGSPGHHSLGFRGNEDALLTATTMVSELQRENEALKEEHTALQQHVGSLEGEMAAMRADLQALRKEMIRGAAEEKAAAKAAAKAARAAATQEEARDDRTLGKTSSKVGGLTRASTKDEPAGTVTVRVLRATGLIAADKGGTSDPYVVVQSAGGKKEKTSVKKGTVNPFWDETLELSVFDVAAPLSFEVWDHDKIGMNDSLGNGEILLAHCSPGTPTALRVALSTQGTVEMVVTFSPAEPAEEPEEFTAAAVEKQKATRKAAEEVEAMVAAAQGAPAASKARRSSKDGSAAAMKLASSLVGGLGAAAAAEAEATDSTGSNWTKVSTVRTLASGLGRARRKSL